MKESSFFKPRLRHRAWVALQQLSYRIGFTIDRKGHQPFSAFSHIQSLLKTEEVTHVFDVGANKGQSLEIFLNLFPQALITSFEPFEESFDFLSACFSKKHNVVANQIALSDKVGTAQLHINSLSATNSLLEVGPNLRNDFGLHQLEEIDKITITTNTIDNYCDVQNINHIDLLKIDVQGTELNVLKGARRMLSEQRIKLLYCESHFKEQYTGQATFADICSHMDAAGYYLAGIHDLIYSPTGTLVQADLIFTLPPSNHN